MSLPPAQPAYLLRAHAAPVHRVRFLRRNTRLLTGDADGWVVLWLLATRRAAAVWRAHHQAILGFDQWADDKIITHGRDSHLRVWLLRPADEASLDTALPVDDTTTHRKAPWLLHAIALNTLNFCAFSMCPEPPAPTARSVLFAVPGTKDGQVDIFQLPTEHRIHTVPSLGFKTGMVMSLALTRCRDTPASLRIVSAYESGATAVHALDSATDTWTRIYASQPHSQPILSLHPSPSSFSSLTFFTSGADDLIAMHTVPLSSSLPASGTASGTQMLQPPAKAQHTKHAGQQSLQVRSDGRILATAGWDGRVRVYSAKTLKEVAVLKWHREGCYAVDFADVGPPGMASGDRERPEEGDGDAASRTVATGPEQRVERATVRSRREERARTVHWLAAGSKDGKVSLWDIY